MAVSPAPAVAKAAHPARLAAVALTSVQKAAAQARNQTTTARLTCSTRARPNKSPSPDGVYGQGTRAKISNTAHRVEMAIAPSASKSQPATNRRTPG